MIVIASPFDQLRERAVERRVDAVAVAERDDRAVQEVDLGLAAGLDVLEHRRLVPVGDVLAGGVVEELLGAHVEHDPLRVGDGASLGHHRPGELAGRRLGDLPVRAPGQRGDRVRGGVEDQLPPLGAARVRERMGRHPGARARVGERLDRRHRRRARLERADVRVALRVPADVARLDHVARRERRAADHLA